MKIYTIKAPDGTESHLDLDKVLAILIPSMFNVNQQALGQVIMQGAALNMGVPQAASLLEAWKERQEEIEPKPFLTN